MVLDGVFPSPIGLLAPLAVLPLLLPYPIGEGLTFGDHRRYVRGDDTRLIDRKLYARPGEYLLKQFEADRSLTVHVLVDTGADFSDSFGDVWIG